MKLIHLSLIIESSAYQRHDISFLFLPHIKCGNKKILYYEIQEIYSFIVGVMWSGRLFGRLHDRASGSAGTGESATGLGDQEREGCDDEGGIGGYSYGRRREYAYGRGVRYGLEYGIYGER